ncbi:MAG TPA: hypothetical protein VIT90_15340 [Lysobacter sp.]
MATLTEATARELIDTLKELTFVVKGLTGVLIDDRDAEDVEEEAEGDGNIDTTTYMDGSAVTG